MNELQLFHYMFDQITEPDVGRGERQDTSSVTIDTLFTRHQPTHTSGTDSTHLACMHTTHAQHTHTHTHTHTQPYIVS